MRSIAEPCRYYVAGSDPARGASKPESERSLFGFSYGFAAPGPSGTPQNRTTACELRMR